MTGEADAAPGAPADLLSDSAALGGELIRLIRTLHAFRQRVRDESQWGWGDRMLLGRLVDDGEQRATDLAQATLLDLSTVSRQVRSLIDRGLVDRRPDPEDKRGWLLAVTGAGATEVRRYREQRDRYIAEVLAPWPAADRQELVRLLACFTDDMSGRLAATAADGPQSATSDEPGTRRPAADDQESGQ